MCVLNTRVEVRPCWSVLLCPQAIALLETNGSSQRETDDNGPGSEEGSQNGQPAELEFRHSVAVRDSHADDDNQNQVKLADKGEGAHGNEKLAGL